MSRSLLVILSTAIALSTILGTFAQAGHGKTHGVKHHFHNKHYKKMQAREKAGKHVWFGGHSHG